ncbi:MAG: LPS export ABC transporter permease LptG [Chromatiales bacterium]|nr:LPS export ABC transporter permease LptG [Chromatiales bacterium]
MTRLDRYLARSVALGIVVAMAALLALIMFLELIRAVGDVGGGYQLHHALWFVALRIPKVLYELFPSAALIGTLIGMGMLARSYETVAMRAAGVSIARITIPVLAVGIIAALLVVIIGEAIAPVTSQYGERMRAAARTGLVTLRTDQGFWTRDGNAFLNIRKVVGGRQLTDIYFYELNEQGHLRVATRAASADYEAGQWILHDLEQSQISDDGVSVKRIERAAWASVLDPEILSVVVVSPDLLPIWELYRYADFLRSNGQRATEIEHGFWTRIVNPLNVLVLMIVALPFVFYGNPRSTSIGQRIFLGVLTGIGFYLGSRALSQVGLVYSVNPLAAASLPTLAILAVAGVFLVRAR